ncbi:MAG: LacI family DNA-binding transcriptional regulator [Deinococcota bacterium]
MTINKPSNIIEVAEHAGVSTMTVSRYFNQPDKLAEATKEKVRQAVEELAYVPNAAAVTLLKGRSETLALILPDINNPFFTAITRGAEDAAQARGYTMFVANTDENPDKEREYLDSLVKRRVDGVLVAPAPEGSGLSNLAHHNIPVVLLDRQIRKSPFDTVRGNSFEGGRLLTAHVIDQGHSDIAFVGGLRGVSTLEQRLQGYHEAMVTAGLMPQVHLGRYDEASGYEIGTTLYQTTNGQHPKTLLAANNRVAVGLMKALQEQGLWHTDGVKLASFDNIDPYFFAIYKPFIAVVAQPAYDMGKRATDMLIERIEGFQGEARDVVLPVQLIT